MSAPSGHDRCEPNLTPLLDMVLQLVMFFMLCANFIADETNALVKLPDASAARTLDKSAENAVYINLTFAGKDKYGNEQPETLTFNGGTRKVACSNAIVLQDELETQLRFDKLRADKTEKGKTDWATGKGRSLVIVRADARHDYKKINEILMAARGAGYSDIQLRAIQKK